MGSPFIPWMGGKRRLAKEIVPEFPDHQCYVEPFAGGAAIFFMKEPSKSEVLNDINGELVNLYRVVANHLEEFLRQFKWALVSREMFNWQKMGVPETLTDIQRAARFYYLQKLTFGAGLRSQTYGTTTTCHPKLNLLRIEEELSIAHIRLARTNIEHLSWEKVIEKYDRPHTLFYLDPPYWGTAGYGIEFGFENYERIASLSKTITGKMVVSINDHPDILKVFTGLRLKKCKTTYHPGGAKSAKEASELIYFNY